MKRGDRVMVTIEVPGTVNAPTDERNPSGNYWVQIDGEIALTAIHESKMRKLRTAPIAGQREGQT